MPSGRGPETVPVPLRTSPPRASRHSDAGHAILGARSEAPRPFRGRASRIFARPGLAASESRPCALHRLPPVLRRGRFGDLLRRQLDLFELDEAPLLREAEEADAAWTNAPREESEERYGDYQLV